jgi:hypothetical protein
MQLVILQFSHAVRKLDVAVVRFVLSGNRSHVVVMERCRSYLVTGVIRAVRGMAFNWVQTARLRK